MPYPAAIPASNTPARINATLRLRALPLNLQDRGTAKSFRGQLITCEDTGKVGAQLTRRLIAQIGLPIQRFQDHGFQRRGNLGIEQARPHRIVMQNGIDQQRRLTVRKGTLTRRHFIEHCAGCPNVGAGIGGFSAQQLGRHVGHRSAERETGVEVGRLSYFVDGFNQFGQAKVENFQLAVGVDPKISRLEIAMDDILAVRGFQPARQLYAQFQDGLLRKRLLGEHLVQIETGDVFRDQVIDAILLPEVEGHGDVGMVQLADRQRLFAELFASGIVGKQSCGQDLDRDVALQLLIMGAKDHAHASGANLFDQPIVPQYLAAAGGLNCHCSGY